MNSRGELFRLYLAQTSDSPLALETSRADGIYIYDIGGRPYIDLISGVSVNVLGHRHPSVIRAIKSQIDRYLHLMVYGEMVQEEQVGYARLLAENLHPELNSVYFVNSGSEAVEGALKLARRHTGRYEVISFRNAYHGSTQGALSIMGGEEYRNPFRPLAPGNRMLGFNSFDDIRHISLKTAAVVVEPVQAEAGVIVPADGYLEELHERCQKTGALLIFDEVQTGFGRTGPLFAFHRHGIRPDIIILAKALGGGLPLGAFACTRDMMKSLSYGPPLGHITTFGGSPLSCAAGKACLEFILSEKLHDRASGLGELFEQALKHREIRKINRSGLLMAVKLKDHSTLKKFIRLALEQQIITDGFLFDDCSFRISPPLVITEEEINQACTSLLNALDHL